MLEASPRDPSSGRSTPGLAAAQRTESEPQHPTGPQTKRLRTSTEESGVSVHHLTHLPHQLDTGEADCHMDALRKEDDLLQDL